MNPLFISIIIVILSVLIGIPIFFSMGVFVLSYLLISERSVITMVQALFSGMNMFTLIALPLFLLTGEFMNRSGLTKELVELASLFVGKIRGGLALINILVSIIFAGVSGVAVADSSAIGSTLIPMMEKNGYDKDFSVAVTASSSTIGPIIPPSGIMVLVGISTRQSIGALFAAGFIPGVLMGFGLMLISYIIAVRKKYPVTNLGIKNKKEVITILLKTFPALLVPLIIVGGISFGVFSPSEAAAVAAVYCLIYSITIGNLKVSELVAAVVSSCKTTGSILWIIGAARGISWLLAAERIPNLVMNYINRLELSPIVFLLLINLLLLIVGSLIETSAALFIFAPVILPAAMLLGIDPLHMAFIIGMNLCIGLTTPPFGLTLYVSSKIANLSLEKAMVSVLPFVAIQIVVLLLISFFPRLVLIVPHLIGAM